MGNRCRPTVVLAPICRAKPGSCGMRRSPTTGEAIVMRISLVTGASLAFVLGPLSSVAWAQYYIGAQAGWTGLPYQTDTIDGLGPVAVQFSAGYNIGVRSGYQLASWRFEAEYSHRRNNVAEYNDSTNGVSGNRHTNSTKTTPFNTSPTACPFTPHWGGEIVKINFCDALKPPAREW